MERQHLAQQQVVLLALRRVLDGERPHGQERGDHPRGHLLLVLLAPVLLVSFASAHGELIQRLGRVQTNRPVRRSDQHVAQHRRKHGHGHDRIRRVRLTARAQLRARRQEREGVARQPPVVPGQAILVVRLGVRVVAPSVGIHRVFRRVVHLRPLLGWIPDPDTGAHDVREVGQRGDGVLGEPSPRRRRVVIRRNRHPRIVAIRRHPLVPLLPQTHRPYGAAQGTQRLARLRIVHAHTAE
mmetsp:Transcript_8746/g.38589  ORF Transcript_8746/g.38589 Transcript_8746/m.38589 type:complete len:240 (-) Transcript_8746:4232-4951(-)